MEEENNDERSKNKYVRIIKVLIFVCVFLGLKSCLGLFYLKMTHLSKEDLMWIKTLEQKSSHPIFCSDSLPSMRLSITEIGVSNDTNPFYISSYSSDVYEANAYYKYTLKGKGKSITGMLSIARVCDTDSLVFYISLGDYSSEGSYGKFLDYSIFPVSKMEVGGKEFDDCVSPDASHWKYARYYDEEDCISIEKVIVSKKYGLIYYKFSNGTEYYRDFQ